MVVNSLGEKFISAGAELTRRLDERMVINAAFWLFQPEGNSWRLIFSTPDFDIRGPKKVYSTIHGALANTQNNEAAIPLSDIALLSPTNPLIQLLRKAVATGPGISGIQFSGNSINGQYIEDAYIYRMHFNACL